MDVRSRQSIVEHLQKEDAQERIIQSIHRGRDEATVTISRAAELFGITENKLRDWEEYGFLTPLRPGGPKGRRLYSPTELDKLAIIRELIDAGYTASDIPADIDHVWQVIRASSESQGQHKDRTQMTLAVDHLSIDQRVNRIESDLFWRYFISHVLHIALHLISEERPNLIAGLILPLNSSRPHLDIQQVDDLAMLGESLVGWLSPSGSSQALLTAHPHFRYSSDFRIEWLQSTQPRKGTETGHCKYNQGNRILIVLQREASTLHLDDETIETIQRLLQPLYDNVEQVRTCMNDGTRDIVNTATEMNSTLHYEDAVLNGLATMVIRIGGKTVEGKQRWRFCWILLPHDNMQATPVNNLVVRAQNIDTVSASKPAASALFEKVSHYAYSRALYSRHISYQPDLPLSEPQELYHDEELPIRSDLALPITGEGDSPSGVLYVASQYPHAFTTTDQRVLRLLNLMIEEVLRTYAIRQQATRNLSLIVKRPQLVDPLFGAFLSANDFTRDIDQLLARLWETSDTSGQYLPEGSDQQVISFIAIDVDRLMSITNMYGDRVARNLTREIGLRIQEQLRTLFKEYPECQLYHIHNDRFFIVLHNTPLEQTREHAERLHMGTNGTYRFNAQRIYPDQHMHAENMIELRDITVRLAITSYKYQKLCEILHKHNPLYAVSEVRSIISSALEAALARGQVSGGNVVISWDHELRNFILWPSQRQ